MTARFHLSPLSVIRTAFVLLCAALLPVGASAGITPAVHDFGVRYVGGTPTGMVFTIDNPGSDPLTVGSPTITGSEASDFSVSSQTCQAPVPAGGSCTVTVTFAPSASGVREGRLDIATDDPLNLLLTAPLSGTGIMQRYILSLSIAGDGSGTVHSSPGADMACSTGVCANEYDTGTTVTLTTATAVDSLFAGWSGCSGVINNICTVAITGAKYVTASFVRDRSLLNYRWEGRGPDGGVVNSLALSPAYGSDDTIFAGTSGGVFKSVDRGSHWTAVNSGLASFEVRAVAISPAYASDRTLYAATAAGLYASGNAGVDWVFSGNGIAGLDIVSLSLSPAFASDRTMYAGTTNGVYRSTDAGATWTLASAGLSNQTVRGVAVSPAFVADNTVLAATAGGIFRSDDRGDTWLLLGNALYGVNVTSISISPEFASDGIVYAGADTGDILRFDIGSGDWVSVKPSGNNRPVISLAVSAGFAVDRTLVAGTSSGLYLTDSAGASWTLRNVVNWGSRYFGAVALSPFYTTDTVIYVGNRGSGVLFSDSGGAFWFTRSTGLSAVPVRSIAYSPDYSGDQTAFITALGGVYRTVDRGASWSLSLNGIDTTDLRAVAVSPAYQIDRTLFAGSDIGLYKSSDNGLSWTNVRPGFTVAAVALSPGYAANRTVYAAAVSDEVYRSFDGGGNWETVNSGLEGRRIHHLSFTPNGLLFAGTDNGLYRLSGTTWQPVTAGAVAGGNGNLLSLAASPDFAADGTLYAATYGGGVLVTRDGGATWETANTDLSNLNVQSLALAPDFPISRTLFAATAGGGIFRSTSGGALWVSYNNDLPNQDIMAIAVSPSYAMDRQLFAGSAGSGLFRLVTTEPQLVVGPSAVSFGTVPLSGTSGNRAISLGNTGQADLRVESVTLAGVNSVDFNMKPGSCPVTYPFTLAPGQSCTVSASFDPLSSPGAKTATVSVASDSTPQPVIIVALYGTAYDPPPVGSININNFAAVTVSADVVLKPAALDNSGVVAAMRFSNDNEAWSDWTMYAETFPWRLSTIGGDGPKTVYVQYRDGSGNVSDSFQDGIVLDSTPPVTTITSMPATNYNFGDGIFEFVASKPLSTFTCRINEGAAIPCVSPFSFSALADGPYTIAIVAVDPVGNVGPAALYSWTVDTVPPDTSVTAAPPSLTNSSTAPFVFSANEAGAGFQCKFDNGPWAPCPTPYTLTEVPDGVHTLSVRARDLAGNNDPTPTLTTWTVDTAPPVTTIAAKPANPTNLLSGSVTFTVNEPASSHDCSLDGVVTTGCSSPFSFSGLAEGLHTVTVRSRDLAGNLDTVAATYTWRVDITPPATTITAKPALLVNQNSATFTFAATETGSTFECSLDAAPFAVCVSPLTLTGLAEGTHSFTVRAIDPAGNPDPATALYDWTVDTVAPDTTITSTPPDPSTTITSIFTFTATDAGATFQCSMDNGPWGACVSGVTYSALPNGLHTFRVRAVDAAGNADQTPASYSWTVNLVSTQSVKVVSGGLTSYYNTISQALAAYPVDTVITVMLKSLNFVENVTLDRNGKVVLMEGGYNDTFTGRSGMTPVYGSVVVVFGTLIADGIEIR